MAYVNYEVIIGLLAKLLLVVYIPYGFVQLIVAQCSNILAFFKDSQKRKKERVRKDEPVIKEKNIGKNIKVYHIFGIMKKVLDIMVLIKMI